MAGRVDDQECLVPVVDRRKNWQMSTYSDTYPSIIYGLMKNDWGVSKSHLAKALGCCVLTINRWLAENPDFKEAFEKGKAVGESKYRDKVKSHAFTPSKEVNNGLIKLLGKNMYDIGEDPEPAVIVTNIVDAATAEAQLQARGIPVPAVGVEDMED